MKLKIAIDGPAGAGKSTVASLLAKKLNVMYINTGAMYRAVTYYAMQNNISLNDTEGLKRLIHELNIHFEGENIIVNNDDITSQIKLPIISSNVSGYSAVNEVRNLLVKQQQQIAENYSVVMDGRDIGTVVLKDADFKFFLTASPEIRAQRRYDELKIKNINKSYEEILIGIKNRDYADSHRKISPLTRAFDAIEIDSSYLTIEEVIEKMMNYVKNNDII